MLYSERMLRPDTKGRITLGDLAKGVSGFMVSVDEETHKIILEPYAEIPAREKWLFDNPEALAMVKRGLKQAAQGRIHYRGSFSQYADDEKDETE